MTQLNTYLAIIGDKAFPPSKSDSSESHHCAIVTAASIEEAKQAANDALDDNFIVLAMMPVEEVEQLCVQLWSATRNVESVEFLDEEAMKEAVGE